MSFELDIGPLTKSLSLYAELSSLSFPEAINKKLGDVALRAVGTSTMVMAAQISIELQTVHVTQLGRGGREVRRPRIRHTPNTAARAILIARSRRRGIDSRSFAPGQVTKEADNMVRGRLMSKGYLKSGWIAAARKLGKPAPGSGVQLWSEDQGAAKPATLESLVGEITNAVVADWKSGVPAYLEAQQSLQASFDIVIADMEPYILRKLDEASEKAGFALR